MKLYSDNDIKIAGDKPSIDIERNKIKAETEKGLNKAQISAALKWGQEVAFKFIEDIKNSEQSGNEEVNGEMLIHRRTLLSFTATVGFEQLSENDALGGFAQKSFLDTIKVNSPELYNTLNDTGAFSFYYLAFRRGNDIERRIGQTFAMLCSHDGDPIFQELGEALYCWFLSVIKKSAEQNGII